MTDDPILKAIDSPSVHDRLLLHRQGDEPLESTIERLLEVVPSPPHHECVECGREIDIDDEWLMLRLPVADPEDGVGGYLRTDIYCSESHLRRSRRRAIEAQRGEADD